MGDGESWRSIVAPSPPGARFNTKLTWDTAREQLVLFGGQTAARESLDDRWTFDGESWTELVPEDGVRPPGRGFFGMTYDPRSQHIVVIGGSNGFPPLPTDSLFADHWVWNGHPWSQVSDAIGPGPRGAHSLEFDGSRIILFGGIIGPFVLRNDTWAF